jgi:Fe-S-cluster containining protein
MTDKEVDKIKDYIKQKNIKPCNHIPPLTMPGTAIDFLCPFLNTNEEREKCTIYEVRPTICKAYVCSDESAMAVKNRLTQSEFEELSDAIRSADGKQIPPANVWQTFYPDIYEPKKGDRVVLNKRYPIIQMQHKNMVFEVMGDKDNKNEVVIQYVDDRHVKYSYDIAGLTKII